MNGKVVAIQIATNAGDDMTSIPTAFVEAGRGIQGDRYHRKAGAWSKSRVEVPRDLTLISEEAFDEANAGRKVPFTFADSRRNVLVKGVDLNSLVGVRFRIGNVFVEGAELCDPCDRPDNLSEKTGFKTAFDGKGGLRVKVLRTGIIGNGVLITR